MILLVQILLLCIGLLVFVMQHRMKQSISVVASKLVYWTTLLFISLTFNRILLQLYPENYSLVGYMTRGNMQMMAGLLMGYILLQAVAPSRSLTQMFHKLTKKLRRQKVEEETNLEVEHQTIEKDSYLKEMHFETFLETLCWLGMTFTVLSEVFSMFMRHFPLFDRIQLGLKDAICVLMIFSMPITIRQIIFYLYRIRTIKEEESLTEVERKFQKKLRKENIKL